VASGPRQLGWPWVWWLRQGGGDEETKAKLNPVELQRYYRVEEIFLTENVKELLET
jgi:hypothetical protein